MKQNNADMIPVAPSLIKNKFHRVVSLYMQFIAQVRSITENLTMNNVERVRALTELEDIFYNETSNKSRLMRDLKKEFVKELLAPALVKDIIAIAKKDASDFEFETWSQLVNYTTNYYGTIARFFLALYDESPSSYIPAASLFGAYQMLICIKNMKTDAKLHIPREFMDKYGLRGRDLRQAISSAEIKNLISDMLKEIKKILKDAEILPEITKDLLLRMQFCMIKEAAQILYHKIKRTDVLAKDIKLSKIDNFDAYFAGLIEGMFTSYKDVSTKGLKR